MPRRSSIRESDIQKCCEEWLRWNGWCVSRLNSGAMFPQGANGKRYKVALLPEGTPDLQAFKRSEHGPGIVRLIYLEIKKPGEEPKKIQEIRMAELSQCYGAVCIIAHSLEELIGAIKQLEKGDDIGR